MIETHIRNIAALMTDTPTVYWGAMYEQNIALDGAEETDSFPAILMYPPIVKGSFNGAFGLVLNEYMVTLSFIQKIELHEEQNTNAVAVIQAMRTLVFEFLAKANNYIEGLPQQQEIEDYLIHSLNPTDKLNTAHFFDQYDLNVAGVGLTVGIPILENIADCT